MKRYLSFVILVLMPLVFVYGEVNVKGGLSSEDFLSGKHLKLQRQFLNNLFAVGNDIIFDGTSHEDLMFFGLNVEFRGDSEKDVYLFGDVARVSGRIKGNLRVVARQVTVDGLDLDGNAQIIAPAVWIAENTNFGSITTILSNEAQIGGTYRILHVKGRKISFSAGSRVLTELVIRSEQAPNVPPSTIKGCDYRTETIVPQKFRKFFSAKYRRIFSLLSLCLPFMLMIFYSPRLLKETVEVIERNPVRIFFTGLVCLVLIPLILFLVMLTVIGAPLGLIFFTFYLSMIYLCRGFTAIAVGRIILRKARESRIKIALSILIGTGIFVALTSIPHVNYVFQGFFITLGLGGLVVGRIRLFLLLRSHNML